MDGPGIRVLKPGDEAALEAFLLPRIESSMFLVGNMRSVGLIDKGQTYQGTYVAAFEGGKITGVVAHYWNRVLVFQAPVLVNELWQAVVGASQRPIKGLIGPSEQVAAAEKAAGLTDVLVQLDETENLYALALHEMVLPDRLQTGAVRGRRIEPRDLDVVTAWNVAFAIEALGEEDSSELRTRSRAGAERSLKERRTWILESGGKPVACSSFNTAIQEAVQIGGVYTPPELRGRGYGRAVVAASLLDARAEGAGKAILFTGEDNVAAQKAYLALGFRQIGNYRIVLFRSSVER